VILFIDNAKNQGKAKNNRKNKNHLKKHLKDNHSRRGLLGMVSKRKQLLNYLEKTNDKRYNSIVKKLELKK